MPHLHILKLAFTEFTGIWRACTEFTGFTFKGSDRDSANLQIRSGFLSSIRLLYIRQEHWSWSQAPYRPKSQACKSTWQFSCCKAHNLGSPPPQWATYRASPSATTERSRLGKPQVCADCLLIPMLQNEPQSSRMRVWQDRQPHTTCTHGPLHFHTENCSQCQPPIQIFTSLQPHWQVSLVLPHPQQNLLNTCELSAAEMDILEIMRGTAEQITIYFNQ